MSAPELREKHATKAKEMWQAMDDNERAYVRSGIFPGLAMQAAEEEGFDGHLLCIELMDLASKEGVIE